MRNVRILLVLAVSLCLGAQTASAVPKALDLLPGEGFAITLGQGEVHVHGQGQVESPMGGLAQLVWMRVEGADWSSRSLQFKCPGAAGFSTCARPGGHGRVSVGKALQEGCSVAFLAWIDEARRRWKADYGDEAAWSRLEESFAPFLGRRQPRLDTLPPLTPAWVGEGDLLRTSPEAFLRWLMEPQQAEVVSFGKRFLAGQWVEVKELFGSEGWWFKTATAPIPGEPGATSAWVAGGRGEVIAVLHVPRGRGEQEGLARFRQILRLKGR